MATFVGVGDWHDDKFNDWKVSHDVSRYIQERANPRNRAYTTSPFNAEYNAYILDIYPSQDLQDDHITNQPIIFTVAMTSVFLFVLLSFSLYDWFVERRQRKVMDRAVKSTAVVTSLFPENVREKLYKEISEDLDLEVKKKDWEVAPNSNESLQMMMEERTTEFTVAVATKPKGKPTGKPIADKFDETTVFFMDLAGFTRWSSTREPEQVFTLLETLYGAFDAIAVRRGVFKVETIGDW